MQIGKRVEALERLDAIENMSDDELLRFINADPDAAAWLGKASEHDLLAICDARWADISDPALRTWIEAEAAK